VSGSSHAFPWMFLVFFRVRGLVLGCLGVLGGLVVVTALDVNLGWLRVMGIVGGVLKGISVRIVVRTLFHYSRIREWFMIVLLFLGLHNSCNGLGWLLCRSVMTVFKAYVEA